MVNVLLFKPINFASWFRILLVGKKGTSIFLLVVKKIKFQPCFPDWAILAIYPSSRAFSYCRACSVLIFGVSSVLLLLHGSDIKRYDTNRAFWKFDENIVILLNLLKIPYFFIIGLAKSTENPVLFFYFNEFYTVILSIRPILCPA